MGDTAILFQPEPHADALDFIRGLLLPVELASLLVYVYLHANSRCKSCCIIVYLLSFHPFCL